MLCVAGLGVAVWVTERSAALDPVTGVARVEELSAREGSGSAELAVTVLDTVPAATGSATTVAVALPPAGMVPSEHVTMPADWPQTPPLEEADWKMTPGSSVSESPAPRASLGPAFAATMV